MIFSIHKSEVVQASCVNRYYTVSSFTEGRRWRDNKGREHFDPDLNQRVEGVFKGISGSVKQFNRGAWTYSRLLEFLEQLVPGCEVVLRSDKKRVYRRNFNLNIKK